VATLLPTEQPAVPELQRFHTGEKLTVYEASRLLNDRPTKVVLCAGAQWSGKTTFLARLGEMFRDGSFSHYRFAGSLTLCAFERASWLATITSGATKPDTRRTDRRENDTFYHLRVHPNEDIECQHDILLSDLAGETFPTAVALRGFCADLNALARADHLVMFLDCARLADPARRHPERNNVREFLQRVCAVENRGSDLRVQVIFSRWDYITRDPQRIALEEFCTSIEIDFASLFASSFSALDFYRIAARPEDGKPTNSVIQSLFAYWLQPSHYKPSLASARNSNPARDFSAFGLT
jgi:hypothetical protein